MTGLQSGTLLIGIDLRPSTGVLYGVSNNGGLYTLNAGTGAATFIGSFALGAVIGGAGIGVDFNPVPDLAGLPSLRVTTAFGSNLRVTSTQASSATPLLMAQSAALSVPCPALPTRTTISIRRQARRYSG